MMKTAVVTGASGFIGGALSRELLQKGVKVYAIDISEEKIKPFIQYGDVIPVKAYFEDYLHLENAIKDDIDVFYHFAFEGGFGGDSLKNYELQLKNTKYTCDAVTLASVINSKKFIFSSTVNEIEVKKYLDQDYFVPRYTCIYSAGKIAAEIIGKTLAYNKGMQFISGLIAMPYGEKNHAKNLPNIVIKNLLQKIPSKLITGNNLYDLIYIEDVANAFYHIGESGKNMKSYYVGHRKLRTFREIVTEIRDILDPDVELRFGEYPDNLDMDYSLVDLDALYNDAGFECKADFRESILKTAEWIKENLK